MKNWRIPWRAAVWLPLRAHPGASLLAVLGIALGVALGLAIALINVQAVDNVTGGLRRLAGQADLLLSRPGDSLAQNWYPRLAQAPGVEVAAPELRVSAYTSAGKLLPVWGIDAFQSLALGQPLVPTQLQNPYALFDPQNLILDQTALRALGSHDGAELSLRVAGVERRFRIIGSIPDPVPGEALAITDIATAQWLWGEEGKISQVALRLAPGVDPGQFIAHWSPLLPPGALLRTPKEAGSVAARASLAYRVNLLVLSLVALFTGAFLVYTTLAFSAVRQRRSLAILRVLGLREREILVASQLQGLVLGLPGALLGVPLGIFAAQLALAQLGGNLGAGYFSNTGSLLAARPGLWAGFALAGLAAALFGAFWPAWSSRHLAIVRILSEGSEEETIGGHFALGGLLLLLAAVATFLPAWGGIPYAAYVGIALLLIASLFLLPGLLSLFARLLPLPQGPLAGLVGAQLRGNPGRASRSLAAIVVAFSLVVAMAVMVGSFRDSVASWLQDILRADIYVQAGDSDRALLPEGAGETLCTLPGVRSCSPLRRTELALLPQRPPVVLLARGMDAQDPGRTLDILQSAAPDPAGPPPIWISEILAGLSHWRVGQIIELPLGKQPEKVRIAGIYRDYAYQEGAISLPLDTYRRWTGDDRLNGVALWLQPGVATTTVLASLRQRYPESTGWQIATPGEILRRSLEIFDQSFAATYALEAVAIVIGLLGISNGFGAQTLLRRQEFALLRCLGLRRRDVVRLLLGEGLLLSLFGIVLGTGLGLLISLILIKQVNPLSFHWQMSFHLPWVQLTVLAAVLLLASLLTMLWSARAVMGKQTVLLHDE
ncbi:ABC transporter permease [Candidatus Igneacidithiobacillus taiwanensis]|uniref:ABC transporter permease n=1 Tax=Candidatus Igneacidithiobacillus taiwanensis TaxID=1945924 RepID=UPI0028A1B32F|nr:FtsX-like permease family protein [Candidatus Igneacidithiobacillus taiwanensis]MCE5360484.1 ABC transporter permease [Acidithiobacillus sp.]